MNRRNRKNRRNRIDHFMYGVPSLESGVAILCDEFDAAPVFGGAHLGLGTHNALLSLGDTYLELIAPDPAQDIRPGSLAEGLGGLNQGGLVIWAVQGDLNQIAGVLSAIGISCTPPVRTERQTTDGDLLVWELMFTREHTFGGRMPFFIDWLDCPHPAATNPLGGQFESMSLSTPDADNLQQVLLELGLQDIQVHEGKPHLSVKVNTGRGPVLLESHPETTALGF